LSKSILLIAVSFPRNNYTCKVVILELELEKVMNGKP